MSAEGRARRQSAGARGGAGAAAAEPEHPRGSEPRQPASTAPQRERPRRLARHLPPQCPRPSKGRAWTRLSKCGAPAPATHRVLGLAPRGCRVAPAARARAPGARPQRALGSLRFARGSPWLAGDSPRGHRERGWAAGGKETGSTRRLCGPPPGYLAHSPKPPRARKFTREQTQGQLGGSEVPSRERSGLAASPFPPLLLSPLSLCPSGPGQGDVLSGVIRSVQQPPSRPAG